MARRSCTGLGAHVGLFIAVLAWVCRDILAQNRVLRLAVVQEPTQPYKDGWDFFVHFVNERGGLGSDGWMYFLNMTRYDVQSDLDVIHALQQIAVGQDCRNKYIGDFHAIIVLTAKFTTRVATLSQAAAIPNIHAGGGDPLEWVAKHDFAFGMMVPYVWYTREPLRVANVRGLRTSVIVGSVMSGFTYKLSHASIQWAMDGAVRVVGPSGMWCHRWANLTQTCRLVSGTCHCGKNEIAQNIGSKYDIEHVPTFYEVEEASMYNVSNWGSIPAFESALFHGIIADMWAQGEMAGALVNLAFAWHALLHALFHADFTPKLLLGFQGGVVTNWAVPWDGSGMLNATHGYWAMGFGQWHKAMRFVDPIFNSSVEAGRLFRFQTGSDMAYEAAAAVGTGVALHVMLTNYIDKEELSNVSLHAQREAIRFAFSQLNDETMWGHVRFNRNQQNNGRSTAAWQVIPDSDGVPRQMCVLPTESSEAEVVIPAPTWSSRFGCPKGSYNTGYQCELCSVGRARSTRGPGLNLTKCFLCPAGKGAGKRGATECASCGPGRSHAGIIGYCLSCDVGTFTNVAGATSCSSCLPGRFQDGTHPQVCKDCLAGTYRGNEDLACRDCKNGYFSAVNGSEACSPCGRGKYASQSRSTQCVACPVSMTTAGELSTGPRDCVCEMGFYRPCNVAGLESCNGSWSDSFTAGCVPCGDGFTCTGGADPITKWHLQPIVAPGYFAETDAPYIAYECKPASYCPGGAFGACTGNRTGLACGLCPNGRWSSSGGICKPCHLSNVVLAISYWPVMIVFSIAFYYLLASPFTSKGTTLLTTGCAFGMILTCLQSLGVVLLFSMPWPQAILDLMRVGRLFMLDLDLLSPSCILDGSSITKYLSSVLFFFQVALIMLISLVVSQAAGLRWRWTKAKTANAIGSFAQFTFTTMTAISMTPMMCFSHPGTNSSSSILRYPNVFCGSRDQYVMLCIGIPLLVCTSGFYGAIISMCVVLPAKASARSAQFLQASRFLFFRFRADTWWWGCMMMTRSLLLSLLPVLAADVPRVQMLSGIGLFAVAGALQVRFWPWKVPILNAIDAAVMFLLALIISTVGAFLPQVQGDEEDAYTFGIAMMLMCLYSSISIVFLMSASAFLWQGTNNSVHPVFLLRRAPDDKLISMKLGVLGESISSLVADSLAERTSFLPFYDLETLEVALTIMDELGLPNTPALPKLRSRVHMPAASSGCKQDSQPEPDAESLETVSKAKQDCQTLIDTKTAEQALSTNWV